MRIFLRIIAALCGAVLGAILGALTIVAVVKGRIVRRIGSEYGDEFTEDEKKSLAAVECSAKRAYKRTGLESKKEKCRRRKEIQFFHDNKRNSRSFQSGQSKTVSRTYRQ